MKMLLIIFGIFCLIYGNNAQVVKCDYTHVGVNFTAPLNSSRTYYTCQATTEGTSEHDRVSRIDGEPEDTVKYFQLLRGGEINTLSQIFCDKFNKLRIIAAEGVQMMNMDEYSLHNCENLKYLRLHDNNIRQIPEYLFYKNKKLQAFWIGSNQLTTLPLYLFYNQDELKILDLNNNQIEHLPSEIFNKLRHLKQLVLANNVLEELDPGWFSNLNELVWLALDGNQITKLPSGIFSSLPKLEKLWLFGNKIDSLNAGSFSGLQNLKELKLGSNDISEVPPGVFTDLTELEELSMERNKLITIHSDSFGDHKHLTKINFNGNNIQAVDDRFIDKIDEPDINFTFNQCASFQSINKKEIKNLLNICFWNYHKQFNSASTHSTDDLNTSSHINQQPQVAVTNFTEPSGCGKRATIVKNSKNGGKQTYFTFPWNAILITKNHDYLCGGTLISNRKVITAAHCIHKKNTETTLKHNDLNVLLGENINSKIKRFTAFVQSINIHPEWNSTIEQYDADIAVLVLAQEIAITKYIQPICLIVPNSPVELINIGKVFGYGKIEEASKQQAPKPKLIDIPIQNNVECYLENYLLAQISSRRTFCGGTGKGNGVCNEDSGRGLMVIYNEVYYLRGIVAASLLDDNNTCDVNTYSIFTNVLRYIDWIDEIPTDDK